MLIKDELWNVASRSGPGRVDSAGVSHAITYLDKRKSDPEEGLDMLACSSQWLNSDSHVFIFEISHKNGISLRKTFFCLTHH